MNFKLGQNIYTHIETLHRIQLFIFIANAFSCSYGTAQTQVYTFMRAWAMLLAKEISTTLWVLITIFNCEWIPSRSLLTTCECKHSWDPLLERSLHRSLNSCPWIHNNCHESLAFVLFPDIVYIVVFQCLNHWAVVGTIFLLSLWNCSDFIVSFVTYMLKVV